MEIQSLTGVAGASYSPASQQTANPSAHAQPVSGATDAVKAVETVTKDAAKAPSSAQRNEEVKQSVEKINKTIQALARNLQFSVDEDTKMNVVKVIDTDTKDVIRQFPSEEALAIAKALDKLQGLLFTDKA